MSALIALGVFVAVTCLATATILAVKEAIDKHRPEPKWEVRWGTIEYDPRYHHANGNTRIWLRKGDQRQLFEELPRGHEPLEFEVALERAEEVVRRRNDR